MLSPLQELLAVGHRQVLEYFTTGLRDVSEEPVDQQQLMYNASVLAHYAQTSTVTDDGWPAPATLATVFDSFVVDTSIVGDSSLMETAGAQCLLLAGFFEDQMRRRHSIRWYGELGAGFFFWASRYERSPEKARLLDALARNFELWRRRHARLSREFRDRPLLLPKLDS